MSELKSELIELKAKIKEKDKLIAQLVQKLKIKGGDNFDDEERGILTDEGFDRNAMCEYETRGLTKLTQNADIFAEYRSFPELQKHMNTDKVLDSVRKESVFGDNSGFSNFRIYMHQLRNCIRIGKGKFGDIFKSEFKRSASDEVEIVALKVIHPFELFERDNITCRLQAIRDELGVMLKARELDHVVKIIGKIRYDMIIINIEQSLKYLICRCCRE